MEIMTADGKRIVAVGTSDILHSLYSTIMIRLETCDDYAPLALAFLKTGRCEADYAEETARQFNLLHDALACIKPEEAVYDMEDRNKLAPWEGNISKVVTSCANLYTTADGKDLLFEIVSILTYAGLAYTSIEIA